LVLLSIGVFAVAALEAQPHPDWLLIQTGPDANNVKWMSPAEVEKLPELAGSNHGTPFMDVTNHPNVYTVPEGNSTYALDLATQVEVDHVASFIKLENPQSNLQYLTGVSSSLQNRRHNTADGAAASRWIRDIMAGYCSAYDRSGRCSAEVYNHQRTPQPSVIARRLGSRNPQQVVIIGAHLDSIAGANNRAPGADDDGTGTITVMEAFRAFLEAGIDNGITLEFQLYAAEEVGLWGSQEIADAYRDRGINVKSMVQFDMNGCCAAGRGFTRGTRYNVCTDAAFTNTALTARLRTVISAYGDLEQGNFQYGYAASDHASFARAGFPACHVKENVNYPPIHSPNDVYENIDFVYLGSFVRVALGFAITEAEARFV